MAVALAETFSSRSTISSVPVGWSTQIDPVPTSTTAFQWYVSNAPSWASGRVALGTLLGASNYLTKTFASAITNGGKVRLLVGTDQSPTTTRCGHYIFYSGTTIGFSVLFFSDGRLLLGNLATADVVLANPYQANTLYDVVVSIGAAGAISSVTVNGGASAGSGTIKNALTSVDTLRADTYNGGLTPVSHAIFDAIVADTSTSAPNGTLASSGTLDGNTLGPNMYGEVVLGYTNGSSVASTIYKLERSANGGGTWATISPGITSTASGFLIIDSRPNHGSQAVRPGATATYRVTAMNASGSQVL